MTNTQIAIITTILGVYGYIYGLRNKINGKWYIGATKSDPYQYMDYQYRKLKGKYRPKLEKSINAHGIDNFDFVLLDSADTKEALGELEKQYIKDYDSIKNGYNCQAGGVRGPQSPEARKNISDGLKAIGKASPMKGKKHKPETIAKMSDGRRRGANSAKFGTQLTEEAKEHLREINTGPNSPSYGKIPWNKGIPASEETKKLLSELGKGEGNSFYGKHHTNESKKKISDAKKGKPGNPHTPETRAKIGASKIGKPRPKWVIDKMLEGRKRKKAERELLEQQQKPPPDAGGFSDIVIF